MKKLFAVLLTGALVFGLFAGCGSSSSSDDKVIKVGATAVPHAEILNAVKEDLAKEGYTLEITEFTDYVQPNKAVEDGSLDANFFQHKPYMDSFNEEQGTNLVSVGTVHYEPLGIYPGKSKDLKNIPDGATIAVPNDTTNEARALLLLEKNGVITLKKDAGLNATAKDIESNPHNVKIQELEAAQIPKSLQDVDFAVINGNYAMEAGLSVNKDAIAIETADSEAAKTYANILCVKAGNEETDKTKALLKALQSDTVKNFIDEKYDGSVVSIFE
ncbi:MULTISPECIES: MetQ/NlpA family ABC transporter substrate-binding protein [Anaerofustis]|uniref:MetQ/NlpA family ABC transporter substrate-binding protein n=1 Tax=Anaerofustis TaxID=264995 RepID=UPI0011066013|nr:MULTISPECIES: MetQ/NlpA family ABC transporter substrate-binding protein [Anaerofustis]MCO8194481.1 MetQ/NlpA family ABC transporter substrate-binding protein [Anaerofustis sp. NSJ-163]